MFEIIFLLIFAYKLFTEGVGAALSFLFWFFITIYLFVMLFYVAVFLAVAHVISWQVMVLSLVMFLVMTSAINQAFKNHRRDKELKRQWATYYKPPTEEEVIPVQQENPAYWEALDKLGKR